MRVSSLLFFILASLHLKLAFAFIPDLKPIRIDSGNTNQDLFDEKTNLQWSKDMYFTSGIANVISEANEAGGELSKIDSTLRSWSTGDSCYTIPVPVGRYIVRLSFAYNDYDKNYYTNYQSNALPSIGVIIQNYFVEEVGGFGFDSTAYYTDYLVFVYTESLSVCFAAFNQQPPFVNSIQVLPADTLSLFAGDTGNASLSNWRRINVGGEAFGEGDGEDPLYRAWSADVIDNDDEWVSINASVEVLIPDTYRYNHLPGKLFNTCRQAVGDHTGYNFTNIHPVNPDNPFLVILYFVEYNETLRTGDRLMNVWANGVNTTLDLLENLGPNQGKMWINQVPLGGDPASGSGGWISVIVSQAENAIMPPVLCGVEVYEIINEVTSTVNTKSDTSIRIDCGSDGNYTDDFGNSWSGDYGFSSGNSSVAVGANSTLTIAQSLRFFSFPKQNCYMIPVSLTSEQSLPRFLIRMLFNYGNYDTDAKNTKAEIPFFSVAVQGTIITEVYPKPPGYFIDAITYVGNEVVEVCLLGNEDGKPTLINALEIFEVDSQIYDEGDSDSDIILYNYYRLNCGGDDVGDNISDDVDDAHRQWTSDLTTTGVSYDFPDEGTPARFLEVGVKNTTHAPNYFPSIIYQTARVGSKSQLEGGSRIIAYDFENLHNGTDILLVIHFAELFGEIGKGERVFDVDILLHNGTEINVVKDLDLAKDVGRLVPKVFMKKFTIPQEKNSFEVRLMKNETSDAVYDPIVSAIEVYRIVKGNPLTVFEQARYMSSLRDTLQVGENLNWQGDPCSPSPWIGVTCVQSSDDSDYYAIETINLSGQGLTGSIDENIQSLTQLKLLNLSNNQINGNIPEGLASMDIEQIDLSKNLISGNIPTELGKNTNLRLLNLSSLSITGSIPDTSSNSNLLIDVSNNPYLCDSPGLPACSSISYPPPGSTQTFLPPVTSKSKGSKSSVPIGLIIGAILGILVVGVLVFAAVYLYRRRGYSQAASSELPTPSNTNIFGARRKPSKTHGFYILERGRAMTNKEAWNMSNIV